MATKRPKSPTRRARARSDVPPKAFTKRLKPRTARYQPETLEALTKLAKADSRRQGRTVTDTELLRVAAEQYVTARTA